MTSVKIVRPFYLNYKQKTIKISWVDHDARGCQMSPDGSLQAFQENYSIASLFISLFLSIRFLHKNIRVLNRQDICLMRPLSEFYQNFSRL